MRLLGRAVCIITIASSCYASRVFAAGPTTAKVQSDDAIEVVLPTVDFDNIPLEKAIDSLREQTKLNLVVRWATIESAGMKRTTPVTLRVANLSLGRVIALLGQVADDGTLGLEAQADRGVIIVTVPGDERPTVLRLYDVRDLLAADGSRQPTSTPAPVPDRSSLARLRQVIQTTVDPESWREAGGTIGYVMEYNGKLLIQHTPKAHERIAKLLDMLREPK